jgi:ABC-type polysaccharide/polyol phosphate transport system ATPase subunit
MSFALRFDGVSKSFAHHAGRRLLRDRLLEFARGSRPRFQALKNVSFELAPGECMGLVGSNGAGKSTTLNMATGLLLPDSGRIDVHGRVTAMLELGAGFHPDLTGAENVRVNAALLGLTRKQLHERFDEIVEFSGLADFVNEPLRTYSGGMIMRLAFSVAVASEPDILLIDEVIGTGDSAFAEKCLEKIRSFQRAGKTMLLASHSDALITMLCQRALWLHRGEVMACGAPRQILESYHEAAHAAATTALSAGGS